MGQKVSPHGLRVGVIKDWDSKWYAGKDNFAEFLAEDNKIRKFDADREIEISALDREISNRAVQIDKSIAALNEQIRAYETEKEQLASNTIPRQTSEDRKA